VEEKMRIAVFGTGGVGGYFGGRLAQAGQDVVFIARGAHLHAIQTNGLRIESIKGDFTISPALASYDPSQVGPVDAVLVGVKAWQIPDAAQAMRPLIGEQTFVVPLENGVEAPEQLASVLGAEHVLGGLCQLSAFIVEPGHIRHVGIEPSVAFGEMDGRPSPRAGRLLHAFDQAGVKADIPADIQAAMWDKFLFIASISGVGAVTRAPMGVYRSLPEARRMLVDAMQEIFAVARARGVNLPGDAVEKRLAFIENLPAGVIASMQRDILEGRPSELMSQNGAVVRMGQALDLSTPVHSFIFTSLLPQEMRARGELQF
jgi:2-dehydropantoate 2-reductase